LKVDPQFGPKNFLLEIVLFVAKKKKKSGKKGGKKGEPQVTFNEAILAYK